jgi:hypothetical protein
MEPDRFESLLKGYALPAVASDLDDRVLSEGRALLEHRGGATLADIGTSLLDALGFGVVAWLVDLITHTDAEYGVELI